MIDQYTIVAENPESTVVSEYQPPIRREASYQSETGLEKTFIEQLQTQAYEYLPITTEQELIVSILDKFDKLANDISEGLPAEIEARRKQYKYYRGKLLTFKGYE